MRCYTEHSTLSVQGMFLPLALDDTARPAVPAVNILGTNDTWTLRWVRKVKQYFFDVSGVLDYLRHGTRFTGIQRVVVTLADAACSKLGS